MKLVAVGMFKQWLLQSFTVCDMIIVRYLDDELKVQCTWLYIHVALLNHPTYICCGV